MRGEMFCLLSYSNWYLIMGKCLRMVSLYTQPYTCNLNFLVLILMDNDQALGLLTLESKNLNVKLGTWLHLLSSRGDIITIVVLFMIIFLLKLYQDKF